MEINSIVNKYVNETNSKFYLVFVNGILANDYCRYPQQLSLSSKQDKTVIDIDDNADLSDPISILHLLDDSTKDWKITLNLGSSSRATILEKTISCGESANEYQVKCFLKLNLTANSKLEYVKALGDSQNVTHLGTSSADLADNATLNAFIFTSGCKLAQNNVSVNLHKENAMAFVNGLYITRQTQRCENFCEIKHLTANTGSNQIFKGVLTDSSYGDFNGKIFIAPKAHSSNSSQMCNNLLLSNQAKVNAKPELEIYCDDVKATHGVAIGQMSEEELFYLQTRGIQKDTAKKILCSGFVQDALELIESEQLKAHLSSLVEVTLGQMMDQL
ncbi:MAG: SufD family Fe-S cluster assembly protein [Bacteriovoracaceae bacterium]|nr:SufD family Fe-S cluster assembly protein [Bacteriovoracaceae bacterium]